MIFILALECDLLGHQVQWMDMQKKNSNTADSIVQFDGIPHICVGNFYLNCQFGVDSSISKKMRRKRMRVCYNLFVAWNKFSIVYSCILRLPACYKIMLFSGLYILFVVNAESIIYTYTQC